MELIVNDKILEIQHGDAVAERTDAEAGDEIRRRLRDGDDLPAVVLLEFLENAADERRFSGGGPSGQHDSCDTLCHKDHSFDECFIIVSVSAEKSKNCFTVPRQRQC